MYIRVSPYHILLSLLLCTGIMSCEPKPVKRADTDAITSAQQRASERWNNILRADSVINLLHTGDVVLRSGRGPDSYLLMKLNQKDRTWSHCGIVIVENGYPFVYHSIGGEDNPAMTLRRDSAALFFTTRYNYGIGVVRYDCDSSHCERLTEVVHDYYRRAPLFDMSFDLATADKLYCSEFVYRALTQAMADTAYIPTSFAMGKKYVGVDDLFLNQHARLICKVRYK